MQEIGQCYKCKYWRGDKNKVITKMAEYHMSMDLFKGWPEYGECKIDYEWAEIDIRGDADVKLEVPANFGCPYFEGVR